MTDAEERSAGGAPIWRHEEAAEPVAVGSRTRFRLF
jgi:hypothetical protein